MSQQPNDSLDDLSTRPCPDSTTPTSRYVAPVTVPQASAASTSISVSVSIPPPNRQFGDRFWGMSTQASLSASSSQTVQSSLLVSSQSDAIASLNVGARTRPVTVSGVRATWTSSPNTSSVFSSDSNVLTSTFPDQRLVASARVASATNLTGDYQRVISTPLPAASSTHDSFTRTVNSSPRERVASYQPSAGSWDRAAARPVAALQSGPAATSWSVPAIAPSVGSVATHSLDDSSTQLPDSTTGSTSAPESRRTQLIMVPCNVPQTQPNQHLPLFPTHADFHAQRTMNILARDTSERNYNRQSHRDSPYARLQANSCDQRVINSEFPDLQLAPTTTFSRAIPPVTRQVDSINLMKLLWNKDIPKLEQQLLQTEKHLQLKREALKKLQLQLASSSSVQNKERILQLIKHTQWSMAQIEKEYRKLRSTIDDLKQRNLSQGGSLSRGKEDNQK